METKGQNVPNLWWNLPSEFEPFTQIRRSSDQMFSLPSQPVDVPKPMSAPGPVLKANSLSNLEQEKSTYRYTVLIKAPRLQSGL